MSALTFSQSIFHFLLVALLVPLTANALPDDRDQPIHIAADKAVRDEKQGLTIYEGNVTLNQGSLRIEADTVTIYRVIEEGDKIVAEGRPARMSQQPELNEQRVHASANIIEYYKTEDRVHLRDDAVIEQDGSRVRGETIDYFITQELVKANSDQSQDSSRVEVTIPPSATQ